MEIAIYSLMAALLFGPNTESAFLLTDAKTEIFFVVEEPLREIQIYDLLKDYSDENKQFKKERKAQTRILRNLHLDREATREDLFPLYEDAAESRRIRRHDYIADRLKVQELLRPEEWKEIVRLSMEKFDAGRKGHDLEHARAQLLDYAPLKNLEAVIRRKVRSEARTSACLEALDNFRDLLVKELGLVNREMERDLDILRRQDATEAELKGIALRLSTYRNQVFEAFLHFRRSLIENSTEKEWRPLSRAMLQLL